MIFVMIAATAGAPVTAPVKLRMLVVPILGVMLGSGFHPSILGHLGDWATTLLILPFFVVAAFSGAFVAYRYIGRYDPVTAYFCAAPGGLNDMLILGAEAGGDEKRIALAHASRIFLVVTLVVFYYAFVLDVATTGDARRYIEISAVPLPDLGILLACAVLGSLIGPKFGLPAPQILGPMLLSGIVHLSGITDAPPPSLAVQSAQIVMGTVIGCRFIGAKPAEIAKDLGLASIAAGIMLIMAVAVAFLVTALTGIGMKETFLSFSPGGLPEMSLLALSLDADVAYIATMHIVRIVLVIAMAPVVFKLIGLRP